MIEEKIKESLGKTLETLGFSGASVHLEHPGELSHGDYATNVALMLAKQAGNESLPAGRQAREVAETIVAEFSKKLPDGVLKVDIAGPGFINFHLSREFFVDVTKDIAGDSNFGETKGLKGKTIMVEYTQPNPFKPFHIGHLMSNTIGEALTRVIESSGAKVIRANYQGDVGLHVAKALWGMAQQNVSPKDILGIGKAYAYGNEMFETNETAQKEINEINKKVYDDDASIHDVYTEGREESLKHFEEIYKTLGTKFDEYFFESEAWVKGKEMVTEGIEKGIFEESQGAVIFPGEKYGFHTRVFITKEGAPTYEAKELGLALLKTERRKFDANITITAVEQEQYFNVVIKALELLRPEFAGKFLHVHHGMMQLENGKMSSRKGNVITGESLIDDMIAKAREKVSERGVATTDDIAESVGVAAIKYMVLKQAMEKNIVFDPEQSLSLTGDSGPYLQYTAVRAASVLRAADEAGITASTKHAPEAPVVLERLLYRFPEIVRRAAEEYAPHHVTQYVTEIASAFNSWYAEQKIVDTENQNAPYFVALTKATHRVLAKGLWILGMRVPEAM